ncbi:ABC transporter substrate-binding protein [Streptomyces radicis]|uniref:ABC transporter substrate-binding protein n=1 Tax=Streptomyces radicis TaxID=1750517 RepID=A0A3A9W885_9ACTN|nr:ABC transporter substrate-binding protein [Streptomyces radicis]RKN09318.1 ABC transporter substrate-binding protein [Streptomyces radicis]RKN23084.1 ABC transporter substrate-binding protein [Streptomyces radicis]
MRIARPRAAKMFAAVLAIGLIATGCASERDDEESGDDGQPFVFGAPGDPASLDPSLASDGETFRVTRQAFETLLDHEPGGTELVGGLAHTWSSNEAGTEWTFELEEGVTFHDGSELTAEVICQNFDRWYNWSGTYQNTTISYYWQTVFGGFAQNESEETPDPNYVGCSAPEELTAVIEVAEPSANYPGGFSLQAFAIHSPDAIEAYEQDEASGEGENITFPGYSQEAGTVAGSGPFEVTDWNKGNGEVTLTAFDDYWGDTEAGVDELVFRTIPEESARRQALQAGDIQGYDLVAPADVTTLEDEGFQVPVRGVFNLLYLGITQESNPALETLEVRQALAHALDRQNIVDAQLPEGGVVATQFMPDTVAGYSEDVTTYDYDPDLARELLAEAGEEDLTLDFCYPTEVTRPYMPAPADIYELLRADLEEVGVTVNPVPLKWNPDYTETTRDGGCNIYLLGWTGDFNDGFNFLGTWFAGYQKEWGFENEELFDLLSQAETEPDEATRVGLYEQVNEAVMDFLPGVPISSSPPSIAFSADVNPPTVSPLTQENFAEVSFK